MKYKTNPLRDAVLLALVASTGISVASAQDASGSNTSSATTLDRIEVTGSRIRSVDLETAQPVFTLTHEDIQKSGLTNVGDLLQNLSISGTQNFSKAAVLTSNPEQGGQYVNIYNLGEQRTLVLVDGKRWVSSLDGYTDLSTIPTSLIDHIDILKDGASAIYGSDAVAGVVNIILRKNFDGMEVSALYGQNSQGDGAKTQYSLTMGATGERSSFVFGASYTDEDPVWAKDRDFTAYSYAKHINSGLSATGPWGRIINPDGSGSLVLNHTGTWDGVGVGADSRDPANYHSGLTINDRYNPTQQMMWAQGTTSKSIFASGTYDLTDNISWKTTAMYTERESTAQVAGYPLNSNSQPSFPVYVDAASYYNPFPGNDLTFYRRMVEMPRVTRNNVKSLHIDSSLNGAFDIGDHGWNWDAGFNYNKYEVTTNTTGNINLLALQKALGPSFLNGDGVVQCGTAANPIPLGVNLGLGQCTPFNIVGGPSASTADALKYIGTNGQSTLQSITKQLFADITGGLFDMPGDAGEFAFAAGVEHRSVDGHDYPDQMSSAGYTTDLAGWATKGRYNVNEAYLEFQIPVLKDVPFAKELSFDVAGRYSNYSNFGSTTNGKYSFTWRPFSDLMVRGTYGEGFRAPTLGDTFGGGSQTYDYYTDPCDVNFGSRNNAAVEARCTAEGLGSNFHQTDASGAAVEARDTQGSTPFQAGVGNASLKPETSKTKTVGLVYSPSEVDGLNMSLDWYRITVSNMITAVSADYVLNQCYLSGSQQYCNQFSRDTATGQVVGLSRGNANLGQMETEGYNFGVQYRLPEFDIGQFTVTLDSNYLVRFRTQSTADAEWTNTAGYWNFPRVRGTVGVNWKKGDLSASWDLRYYGGYRDYCWDTDVECNDPTYNGASWTGGLGANKKGAITYQDVSVSWNAPWNGTVTVGARNIWDKTPPASYSVTNSSTAYVDPMLDYDRYVFMQYTQRF